MKRLLGQKWRQGINGFDYLLVMILGPPQDPFLWVDSIEVSSLGYLLLKGDI
jgi:hypothetical protein